MMVSITCENYSREKRVLIISASYPPNSGGVATHVANLAHGLLKIGGWNVSVLTTSTNSTTYPRKDEGLLQVWKLQTREIPNFCGRRVPLDDVIMFAMKNWYKIKADIIHAHDFDSTYAGWMLKVAFGSRLVSTIHRAPIEFKKNRHRENPKDCFVEAIKIYKLVDRIIVPSKESCKVLRDQGLSSRKIGIIPHGIACQHLASHNNKMHILENLGLTDDDKLILCPARADEHKDPFTFIRAASLIKDNNPELRFVFLITGEVAELFNNMESLAINRGLVINKDIFFKKYEYSDMPTLYRRANVCVIPSLRESFGQTALESFVFKTPVVASNRPALNEIIKHEVNGLLYTYNSPEELAFQVQGILNDQYLAKRLTENALEVVKSRFDIKTMVENYDRLYRGILLTPK